MSPLEALTAAVTLNPEVVPCADDLDWLDDETPTGPRGPAHTAWLERQDARAVLCVADCPVLDLCRVYAATPEGRATTAVLAGAYLSRGEARKARRVAAA